MALLIVRLPGRHDRKRQWTEWLQNVSERFRTRTPLNGMIHTELHEFLSKDCDPYALVL